VHRRCPAGRTPAPGCRRRPETEHAASPAPRGGRRETHCNAGARDHLRPITRTPGSPDQPVNFDTTTTYFEGERLQGFARFGHSKDRRPDRLQLVVGILCTRQGIPIAHRVFPGNTSDVDAFLAAIAELKRRFQVKRVVVVSDRGTVGKRTLEALEAAGFDYIVGVRLRKLKAAGAVLARAGRYREVAANLRVKQVVHEGVRYVVCHNPEAAAEDARERAEIVAHLEQALGKGKAHLVANRGYRRYLTLAPGALTIDRTKVDEDARYDGKWVSCTATDLPADEVALAYKSLWQAERLFRTVKGPLSWRPVYLWTEKRVRGHLVARFLALACEVELFHRLAAQEGERPSYPEVVSDLKALSAIDLTLAGQRYLVRTELPPPRLRRLSAPPAACARHPESSRSPGRRSGTPAGPCAFSLQRDRIAILNCQSRHDRGGHLRGMKCWRGGRRVWSPTLLAACARSKVWCGGLEDR